MSKRVALSDELVRFSRAWWFSTIKNLLWAALVTVLIWVYADMQFTGVEGFHATIRLTTGNNPNVTLVGEKRTGAVVPVEVRLRGSQGALADFRRWFTDKGSEVTYNVAEMRQPGPAPIVESVQSILERQVDLQKLGLTVEAAEPEAVTYRLDRRIRVPDLPVKAAVTGAVVIGEPTVTPSKVAVMINESDWLKVTAALPGEKCALATREINLQTVTPGSPIQVELLRSIKLPDGSAVTVDPEPDSVEVKVAVEQATKRAVFSIAPRIQLPVTWVDDETWNEYKLVRKSDEPWTKQITVEGPRQQVESLREQDIDAYVLLSEDDKKPTDTFPQREVIVRFPLGMQLELVGERPKVSFRLERREAPPATP